MTDLDNDGRDPADAKAWFYLDHRDDIEAWAALRPDARQLLDRHLVGLEADVEELARDLQVDLIATQLEAGSWPRIGLRRSSWRESGLADTGVVIEWERAKLLTPASNQWPYTAVRTLSDAGANALHQEYQEALKPVRAAFKGQTARNFYFWKYVVAKSPIKPEELAATCLEQLRSLWEVAAPAIDRVHAQSTGRSAR